MASARNLCQHSDNDGTQCTSNDYVLCPHCQLQLCLKHLNHHQDLLRAELYSFCDSVDHARVDFDNLVFDSVNHRDYLLKQLDDWHEQQLSLLNKTYAEKKQQLQILCLKSHMEFDIYRLKKEKQLKSHLSKQLSRVLKQRQIDVHELNEMRSKLEHVQRGLDELKQLKIDIHSNPTHFDVNVVKRRYVEAAKPLFNDDDDNLWASDEEEEEDMHLSDDNHYAEDSSDCQQKLSSPAPILSPSRPTTPPPVSSPIVAVKNAPLKLVIKRLQHPTISTKIKYKLHAVNTSVTIST